MITLLVVEDSIIVNRHICEILKRKDYRTISAYSGSSALQKLAAEPVDMVLLDIMMESQDDGIVTSRQIKSEYGTPIIFLTALTDQATISRALATSPYGYIVKPFDEVELLTTIDVGLLKARTEQDLKTSNELMESMLECLDQCLILLDGDYIFYINKKLETITQRSFESLHNQKFQDVFQLTKKGEPGLVNPSQIEKSDVINIKVDGVRLDGYYGDLQVRPVHLRDKAMNLILFSNVSDRVSKAKLEEALRKANYKAIIEGQEMERTRVAREIHDSLGQLLNLVKLQMKLAGGTMSHDLVQIIDQAIDEAYRISENMLPRKILDFPLETCISSLIKQYKKHGEIVTFLSFDVPPIENYLVKTSVYRIVQEGLNNAIKYSKAKNIHIQLRRDNQDLILTIEDDGVGFDVEKTNGNGLKNMQIRADSLGGSLKIESQKKKGTLILLDMPLEQPSD